MKAKCLECKATSHLDSWNTATAAEYGEYQPIEEAIQYNELGYLAYVCPCCGADGEDVEAVRELEDKIQKAADLLGLKPHQLHETLGHLL